MRRAGRWLLSRDAGANFNVFGNTQGGRFSMSAWLLIVAPAIILRRAHPVTRCRWVIPNAIAERNPKSSSAKRLEMAA